MPITQQSLVVHQYVCRSDCRYVGRIIQNKEKPTKFCQDETAKCDTAIVLHLLRNPDCAAQYHDRQFSILVKARTQFHLAALKAIFIKTQQPI